MAATKSTVDSFSNVAAVLVNGASATDLGYAKFNFPFSVLDKTALVISRIEYWPSLGLLVGDGDSIAMALVAAKTIVDIDDQSDPSIVDSVTFQSYAHGTPANLSIHHLPYYRDFSSQPGGGLIVAPNPLSAAIKGASVASAPQGWLRFYYTYMQVTPEEYWQLVESRRVISDS